MNKVTIRVGRGETIDIGNFESTRIDISIESSCDEKAIESKYEELQDWVHDKIKKQYNIITKGR